MSTRMPGPDSREKSGTPKRCTSAHRPSAATPTWSSACLESSSRSCSHRTRSPLMASATCAQRFSSCSGLPHAAAHASASNPASVLTRSA